MQRENNDGLKHHSLKALSGFPDVPLCHLSEVVLPSQYKGEIFYDEGGDALEQVAQRSCGCPIIGSVQSLVGQRFEQPDLVQDVPAQGREVGLDDLQRSLPAQTIL